jgi:hypothetical protein
MALLRLRRVSLSRRLRYGATAAALALILSVSFSASTLPTREHEIKAAALYNIVGFVDWPATSFPNPDAPLVVGVLGRGPIATLLGDFVTNETWHGRRVVLRQLDSSAEAKTCHVVFIARSERARWRSLSAEFARLPVLTVSDGEDFARQGGIIQFAIERNKLRLIVNLGIAKASGLTVSSKVLRLAEVIDTPTP